MRHELPELLVSTMERAVETCVRHVEAGGLPFVGVLVDGAEIVSEFGVNRVMETRDPTAHAEIVAMRDYLRKTGKTDLAGTTLLATGEPCGLCYRFALDHAVDAIFIAMDRDAVATWGFDYRASYVQLGIDEGLRESVLNYLAVENSDKPFIRYRDIH